jgi:hypothetical protein
LGNLNHRAEKEFWTRKIYSCKIKKLITWALINLTLKGQQKRLLQHRSQYHSLVNHKSSIIQFSAHSTRLQPMILNYTRVSTHLVLPTKAQKYQAVRIILSFCSNNIQTLFKSKWLLRFHSKISIKLLICLQIRTKCCFQSEQWDQDNEIIRKSMVVKFKK